MERKDYYEIKLFLNLKCACMIFLFFNNIYLYL